MTIPSLTRKPAPGGRTARSARGRLAPLFLFALALALRLYPHAPLSQTVSLSTAIYSADNQLLRVTLSADDQYRLWTPLAQISPTLTQAFVLKEDQWFYLHLGVNPVAALRAALHTQPRQGASTITMQLARMLYHLNTRTPAGKLKQMALALYLESRYSKHDILEAYLNLAPFGGNIQGVGAATRVFFNKPPANITLGEAVTLAVIPQSPAARGARTQSVRNDRARARLANLWIAHRHPTPSDLRQLADPIPAHPDYPLPYLAPHFVDALLAARMGGSHPLSGRIDTTLDSSLQLTLERQVARYIDQYGDHGIHNTSALLLDTRDMSVKAWLGSADYWNESIDGQVDGVLAKRSPGSALKPFIYAMALDQGILHPRTILKDSPTSFGPFTPENFDGRFFGPIPAQEALIRSRNVPAVWVASQLKQPSLYGFLQSAGISRLRSEQYYGLALALGGGEVTMEELAGLYAMLANQGALRPIHSEPQSAPAPGTQLISPEAAFITVDMLRHNPRPDEDGSTPTRNRWPIAWKTGTSWGFRDAWTAGIVGPYVLVVWIGDFQAKSNPAFVGVEAAAPLFFRIADAVNLARANEPLPAFHPPAGVSKVAVCAESGDLPNAWCPQTVDTWYIPGKSPIKVSQLHRAIAIDTVTGRPSCDLSATHLVVYEFWPSDMLKLFREAGMPRRRPPVMPECAATEDSAEIPHITAPRLGVTYTLRRSRPSSTISLEANSAADVRTVFWFDGDALIGKSVIGSGGMPWRPELDGAHLIRAIDDHGRATEREIQVQYVD